MPQLRAYDDHLLQNSTHPRMQSVTVATVSQDAFTNLMLAIQDLDAAVGANQ